MKFWNVKTFNTRTGKFIFFGVCGSDEYTARDVKKILSSVHPEYGDIKLKKTKPPKNWKI